VKILVLAGGDSSEREVSYDSGQAVCESLKRLGHNFTALDPSTGQSLLSSNGKFISLAHNSESGNTDLARSNSTALSDYVSSNEASDVDVVFIGLHGGAGEDGTVQCLLDLVGMKYTGSSMKASAVAMDKVLSKQLFRSVGVATPDWMVVLGSDDLDSSNLIERIQKQFQIPVVVKPNEGGSTVGLTLVKDPSDLHEAVLNAAKECQQVLIEKYIAGREMTVTVLDGEALPVVEIKPSNELYDYEAKYTKGKSQYLVPAPVSDEVSVALQQAALKMYNIVGAGGLARADFVLTDNDEPYALEINTLPGMTELSLAPMAARESGLEFDQLVERLIMGAARGANN